MSEYANYDDYYDPNEDEQLDAENGKKITVGKIIRKTISITLKLLALAVFVFLIIRMNMGNDPKQSKTFVWTENSITAYNNDPSSFKAYLYKHPDNFSHDGLFSATNVYFVPSIGQFQISVRYNDSTLKYIAEEYKLDKVPTGEQFIYIITDTYGNTYTDYTITHFDKNIYNFNRIVFEGIDLNATKNNTTGEEITTEGVEFYLLLNVYYVDDVVLSSPLGVIPIYDTEFYHEPIDISKNLFKDNKATSGYSSPIKYEIKEEPEDTQE